MAVNYSKNVLPNTKTTYRPPAKAPVQDNGLNADFQLGSANSDAFTVGGWGTQNRANEMDTQAVSQNTVRDGVKVTPQGKILDPKYSIQELGQFEAGGNRMTTDPKSGYVGSVPSNAPTNTFQTKKGDYKTVDPNISGWDRTKRAIGGAAKGYDTGSTLGNVGKTLATNALPTPFSVADRAAGAYQGATSDRPNYRNWEDPNAAPDPKKAALQQALSDGERPDDWGRPDMGMGFGPSMLGGAGGEGDPASGQLPGGTTPDGPGVSEDERERMRLALNTPTDPDELARQAASGDEGAESTGDPEQDALNAVIGKGGQRYTTDGAQGRIGVAGAGGGNYSYAGFDFAQDPSNRDIGKSAKYAFSHFAGEAAKKGIPQPRNKDEAQAWFEQNVKPGMDQLGFTVHKVVGDKAFISAPEHPEGAWVDFQGNSGGQGDQPLTWQAEMGTSIESDPEAIFAVQDWGGGGEGASGMDRGEDSLGGVLDSGNKPLDSFAQKLIKQLLEGAALDDAVGRESSTTRKGITPQSLAAVGF